jgi:lysozyme
MGIKLMDVISLSKDSLKRHEGEKKKGNRHVVYKCSANKSTIGWGRNLDDRGLSEKEAEYLLENDIVECIQDLATFSYWNKLSIHQQAALIDLRFNLGGDGYRTFKMMGKALEIGDYAEAAYQVLHSTYHDQVGKRAEDVAAWLTTL